MRKLILVLTVAAALAACGGNSQSDKDRNATQPGGASASQPGSQPASQPAPPGTPGSGAATPQASPAQPGGGAAANPGVAPGGNAQPSTDRRAESPTPPPQPEFREVTIPAGTVLPLRLEDAVASDTSRVEEPVHATITRPILVRGEAVIPAGSEVHGTVTEAKQSGRVKGLAEIHVRFDGLILKGDRERYPIRTGLLTRRARATKGKDAAKIGLPALGGAVIGGLLGGKKGALVGGTVGAGGGTAVVLSTRGEEVRLPRGTTISVTLLEPVTVRTRS